MATLAEVLDVKLIVGDDVVAAALARVSPEGLVFKCGLALAMHDPSIAKAIDGARYAVGFPRRALAGRACAREVT